MDFQGTPFTKATAARALIQPGMTEQSWAHWPSPDKASTSIVSTGFIGRVAWTQCPEKTDLSIRILKTVEERSAIGILRELSAFSVEKDLGVDLAWAETLRDVIGIVAAFYHRGKLIATMRVVPVGQRLTAIENLPTGLVDDKAVLGKSSWEIGRTVIAPEVRDPELLSHCMVLAFQKLVELEEVHHLHATTTRTLARLWRRFGFETLASTQGVSGERYVVIHATKQAVAEALQQRITREPLRTRTATRCSSITCRVPGQHLLAA